MRLVFSNNQCAAFLTEIVRSFERHNPNGFLGRTAMQKLAYFSKVLGAPIPCSFEIYNYGPYSDQVAFSVDGLLADEVLTDVSENRSRYSSYRLKTKHVTFSPEIEKRVVPCRKQIDTVVSSLGGFRPEQLELVATLHFIHQRLQAIRRRKPTKNDVFSDFLQRKGAKFKRDEIDSAYSALGRAGLLRTRRGPNPLQNLDRAA
jgi:uncharacterized protein YwgA